MGVVIFTSSLPTGIGLMDFYQMKDLLQILFLILREFKRINLLISPVMGNES